MFHGFASARSHKQHPRRSAQGVYLVEALISTLIGAILLAAVMSSVGNFFRYSSTTENQILASNMASQVIDNARNQQFAHLLSLAGAGTRSEQLNLYAYPGNPQNSMFPRPLLRNETDSTGMAFGSNTLSSKFNGTVTETLTDNSPGSPNDSVTVSVLVTWGDQRGTHSYRTSTVISAYGIHN
jgi:type II secretory pathway pseudopilin PulG